MRQGPTNSSRDSRSRPTPPQGVDPTRAGIRSLDCGDEKEADAKTVIRRGATDAAPLPTPADSGSLGEQRQSV
jgi:hypothetical protein